MPQLPADKNHFTVAGGLHTESSPLNFPPDSSFAEQNMEILNDGTRRRRKPVRYEEDTNGFPLETGGLSDTVATRTYLWTDAGGDPDLDVHVVQTGNYLTFFKDSRKLNDNKYEQVIKLPNLRPSGTKHSEEDVSSKACSFSHGRGVLFGSHPYLNPFIVYFDKDLPEGEQLVSEEIKLRVREFKDIEDGFEVDYQPQDYTPSHIYNLLNRGWVLDDDDSGTAGDGSDNVNRGLYTFKNDVASGGFPAKNMTPWHGDTLVPDLGGGDKGTATGGKYWKDLGNSVLEFSPAKILNEVLGKESAAKGALVIDPFDNTVLENADVYSSIEYFTYVSAEPSTRKTLHSIKVKKTEHNLSAGDEFRITGNLFRQGTYIFDGGAKYWKSLDGAWDVDRITTNADPAYDNIYFYSYLGWNDYLNNAYTTAGWKLKSAGFIVEQGFVTGTGSKVEERPSATEFFAGRAWYAGIQTDRWGDQLLFSRVFFDKEDAGKCYQNNSPTDPDFNSTQADDGGNIQIPGLGSVVGLKAFQNSLLVFGSNGVWVIESQGGFAANNYAVNKLSSVPALTEAGIEDTDQGVAFTSPRGIYFVAPNEYGRLAVTSITEGKIQTYWDEMSYRRQVRATLVYDELSRKMHILHPLNNNYPSRLNGDMILDLEIGAFYLYKMPSTPYQWIVGGATLGFKGSRTYDEKMKYLVAKDSGFSLQFADQNSKEDTWDDFAGEQILPYMVGGFGELGDFTRQRWAQYLHVFMGDTGDKPSGCTVQARFNFSKDISSSAFGNPQECYRPQGAAGGYELAVAKLKLRGKGKAIQLRFDGQKDKDLQLTGWSIHYIITGNV